MMYKVLLVLALSAAMAQAQSGEYRAIQAALERGDWDGALGMAQSLLKAHPRDVNALTLKGMALSGRGERVAADDAFATALQIAPTFATARKSLALNQLALKQPDEAETNLKILEKQTPSDPVVRMYLGEIEFRRKDYAGAAGHLQAVQADWKADARLPVMMAECDFHLHKTAEGVRLLEEADLSKLNPIWQFHAGALLASEREYAAAIPFFEAARNGYPEPYDVAFNLGVCYTQTSRFKDAIAVLSAARDGGKRTAELDNLLAEAYEDDKQTKEAIDLLREATQLAPMDEKNYVDLGMLCADHNAYELGLEVVQVGLHYVPNSDALLMQRAVIYAMNGRYDEAEKDFLAASHDSAVRDSAAAGLGLTYLQKGDVTEAVSVLRERAKKFPENAAVQYLLGEALIRSGAGPGDAGFAEALVALERSVRLNPRFVHSRVDLAKLYLRENRNSEAIAQLREAIVLDPHRVQAFAELGAALRKEGKPEEAAPMFAKVRELNDLNRKSERPIPLFSVQ